MRITQLWAGDEEVYQFKFTKEEDPEVFRPGTNFFNQHMEQWLRTHDVHGMKHSVWHTTWRECMIQTRDRPLAMLIKLTWGGAQ